MIYHSMLYSLFEYLHFLSISYIMRNTGNFMRKRICKTFLIGPYFLLTSRLQDWTLQSNLVNIIIYVCKELIFRTVSSSSFFPQITPEPTTVSISVEFKCECVCFINSLIHLQVFDKGQKRMQK